MFSIAGVKKKIMRCKMKKKKKQEEKKNNEGLIN